MRCRPCGTRDPGSQKLLHPENWDMRHLSPAWGPRSGLVRTVPRLPLTQCFVGGRKRLGAVVVVVVGGPFRSSRQGTHHQIKVKGAAVLGKTLREAVQAWCCATPLQALSSPSLWREEFPVCEMMLGGLDGRPSPGPEALLALLGSVTGCGGEATCPLTTHPQSSHSPSFSPCVRSELFIYPSWPRHR